MMDIMKKNEAVSKEFLDSIVAETRAIIPAGEIFLEHANSPLQETGEHYFFWKQ